MSPTPCVRVIRSLLVAFLAGPILAVSAAAQASGAAGEVLTNESVMQMVTGKVPKDLIVAKMRSTKTNFDVSPSGLITLNLNKVPTDIITSMILSTASGVSQASREVLNNDGVIKMVVGQLPKAVIVAKIQTSRPDYDLTTNGILSLNQNKVSADVVKAMMAATAGAPTTPPAAPSTGRRGGGGGRA